MADAAIYTSRSTVRSLWQEYRIYDDRVVFETHFGTMTVPFANIERIEISESEVKGLLRGDLHLKNFRPALKLDWANFVEHVVLDKKEGGIRRILFTPDHLDDFRNALNAALARYRDGMNA